MDLKVYVSSKRLYAFIFFQSRADQPRGMDETWLGKAYLGVKRRQQGR